jgi:hypothetical protein
MQVFVIVDVGCIECGEPSKIVGVFKSKDKAEESFKAYLKKVGASEKYEPSSDMKLFLQAEKMQENRQITEQGYFDGGQHSVEVYTCDADIK